RRRNLRAPWRMPVTRSIPPPNRSRATSAPSTDTDVAVQSVADRSATSAVRAAARVTLPVEGMTCAACQVRVQRVLAKTPGVDTASVNLMLHNAVVTYDAQQVSPADLV